MAKKARKTTQKKSADPHVESPRAYSLVGDERLHRTLEDLAGGVMPGDQVEVWKLVGTKTIKKTLELT